MTRRPTPCLLVLVAALAAAPSVLAEEPSPSGDAAFIIVNPAGRGNQSQAQAFLADFARALEASWPAEAGPPCPSWSGHYHVHQADALASIRGRHPVIGLLSPGFFLAVREELSALPRLLPVRAGGGRAERVHAIALAGSAALASLARRSVEGLRLGGHPVGEPVWTRRVLLQGLAGAESAELAAQERTLGALRALRKGEVDAVLLVEEDWLRIRELGLGEGLVSAHVTEGLLAGPLASLEAADEPRRGLAEAAVEAVSRFPETEAGRAVLEKMGLEGFAPVGEADYHRLASLYEGAETSP